MPPGTPPLPTLVADLRELVVAYVMQETVLPIKQLGRWIALGLAGALLIGIGGVFLTLAALRVLQTETGDVFDGNWSWAPYLIVTAALGLTAAITWKARGARRKDPV